MAKKTCLVTGGAGFIGSHVCTRLVRDGYAVVCFDNLLTGKERNIAHLKSSPDFVFVKGNANNLGELSAVFESHKFEYVFHYAAIVGVQRTNENPIMVLEDVLGIRNILELSKANGVKKIMYSSSSEVYGDPVEIPEKEDGHVNAKIPYAVVKLWGEAMMKAYYQEHGLRTTSLRFFNVFGPRQDSTPYGFVVGIFIKQVLNGEQPTIFGDGTQTRDFVFVEDNVEAQMLALNSKQADGEVINIGTGKTTTVLELAKMVIGLCGKPGLQPKFLPARKDVKHRFPDISKMQKLLNYKPTTSLASGLQKTIEYYKGQMKHEA